MSDKRHNSGLIEAVRVRREGPAAGDSGKPGSFVERVLSGVASPDDIDDFVERWHRSTSSRGLAEFLGFTPAEYARWVESPESLEALLAARRKRLARSGKLAAVLA